MIVSSGISIQNYVGDISLSFTLALDRKGNLGYRTSLLLYFELYLDYLQPNVNVSAELEQSGQFNCDLNLKTQSLAHKTNKMSKCLNTVNGCLNCAIITFYYIIIHYLMNKSFFFISSAD